MPNIQFRKFHRKVSPVLFLPLLLTALTGVAYRFGRGGLGLSEEFGNIMMVIHEGRFLGQPLVPVYVLLLGLGLVAMVVTGTTMIRQRKQTSQGESRSPKISLRLLHGYLAPVFLLPLVVSGLTGVGYRVGKAWFRLSDAQAELLMNIHQGNYLGSPLSSLYILLVGLGLAALSVTGIQMTGIFRNRSVRS